MKLLEQHHLNLATVLRHYNKLTRPMRRRVYVVMATTPHPDTELDSIDRRFFDDYIEVSNLAAYLTERFDTAQLCLEVTH